MSQFGPNARIKFKQPPDADIVANRVRFHAANTQPDASMPYDEVPVTPPDADGFTYITVGTLPKAANLDGAYDVAITAVDDAGQEGPFLDIDNVDFDFVPPGAPTDGTVVE